ncbi:MAG TPA: formyltetrahydrofolate deformylase [Candidatus Omnitrophota bacterium]|nr:formyltetrahydrofolate deformylase [Candidatus Omnitrophota bacterium]HPD83862.1 formyltetrahydrofolate deformylase [Candidatus Omnitrophota bacterium]HRZ02719.1 formyltetrahydrofolate deformylase [Candidatus Omnitrophota bacterium]
MPNAILLISCRDKKGITATVTDFVFKNNGNIEHADQHIDAQSNIFFMRIEWSLKNFKIAKNKIAAAFKPIAGQFAMDWNLYFTDETPRVAIFVSSYPHCLYDLLLRHKAGQLKCAIPLIISNHKDAKTIARDFGIKFLEFPITQQNKLAQERKQIALLRKESIEMVILARYGQIFTKQFVDAFPSRIINIHHSFLPAFAGSSPYDQAYRKGVKIIGATSHYVVSKLDAGPIIEQDTVRVSHRASLEDLKLKGEDLEKVVLSRAVRWHLERKILVYNNKTVIFD